jgi:hypothetical protein
MSEVSHGDLVVLAPEVSWGEEEWDPRSAERCHCTSSTLKSCSFAGKCASPTWAG